MADLRLKKTIVNSFKLNGLTLRSEASRYLLDFLSTISAQEHEENINRIIEGVLKQPLKTSTIEKGHCESSVAELNQTAGDDGLEVLRVIDAFSVPNFVYDSQAKKFQLCRKPRLLIADASEKINLFLERYKIIHQRTMRHEMFTTAHDKNLNNNKDKFQLKSLEYLLGSSARLADVVVLGMLSQMKEGKWYLEDPSGCIKLDLAKTNFHVGLFTENCFVIAAGCYDDNSFQVNALGFPPPEPAHVSRQFLGNTNLFGSPHHTNSKEFIKLQRAEEENEDAMMVFLSDLWLDDQKVMSKFGVLLEGYSSNPPCCFVLCGNFLSKSYGQHHPRVLRDHLKSLASLLLEYPVLIEASRFLFVPGPLDPAPSPILPRPPISKNIHEVLTSKIASAQFVSNPLRLQFCTKEVVVFRENMMHKMCRNTVKHPSDGDIPTHFAKTITSQNHLCPLPLHVEPVYWSFDSALRLYPLPDLIVCADWSEAYSVNQLDCCVTNPGSFPRTDFSFKVYWPVLNKIEDSKIPDE